MEKLLRIFLNLSLEKRKRNPRLIYALKLANPEIFKKIFELLDEKNQFLIKKQLQYAPNTLIMLIQNN